MATERHALTKLPRDLIERGFTPTTYRRAYSAAVDGVIPAQQNVAGRWTYDPADIPAIADALGLSDAVAA